MVLVWFNNNPVKCTVWNLKFLVPRIQYEQCQVPKTHMFVDTCILFVSALRDESPAGFHLHIQSSLHTAHLHVLMQVSVHVTLSRGQFQLQEEDSGFWTQGNIKSWNVSFTNVLSPQSLRWCPGTPALWS